MKTCKLRLQSVPKLEDSHFLSAGIYRRLRDATAKNPNPVLLTPNGAVPTSKQIKAHLLCSDCEQRFSKNGENWVLARCLQADGRFPLAAVLASKEPDVSAVGTSTRLHYAARIPEVDVAAVTYFGASIFWRGAIHPWNTDGRVPVPLGAFFQEQLRQYLMGLQPFPQDYFSLWVVVREGKEIDRLTYAPAGNRIDKLHSYRFPMPGFCFMLFVSKNLPARVTEKCFASGSGNPLIATDVLERHLFNEGVALRRRSL
jgi:hypothetical protein